MSKKFTQQEKDERKALRKKATEERRIQKAEALSDSLYIEIQEWLKEDYRCSVPSQGEWRPLRIMVNRSRLNRGKFIIARKQLMSDGRLKNIEHSRTGRNLLNYRNVLCA